MAKNVTAICAPKIASFLQHSPTVGTLEFPSLSRLRRTYHPSDYREAGRIIGGGKIEIYESGKRGLAAYEIDKDSSLTFGTRITSENRSAVIVHEVTHMIQDMRQMKMSILEMELDAYFAEALYHVRRGTDETFEKSVPPNISVNMRILAENYEDDEKYLKTKHFRWLRGEAAKAIRNEYHHRHGGLNVDKKFKNNGLQF